MGGGWSSTRGKVLAAVGAGVLSRFVPPALVDEVLAEAGRAAAVGSPCRPRFRLLPDRVGVYFVLGLCLFSGSPYAEVLRTLTSGLTGMLGAAGWQVPASTALTQLRRRLGAKPFELLFWRLCGALSPGTEPWSHICGLLAVAWDATTVKAPASQENTAAFGKPGTRRKTARAAEAAEGQAPAAGKDAAWPQLRLVTLIACGTRALAGAAVGPLATGERKLAASLLGSLREGMLLLADRGYYSYQLWQATAQTGAHLLWRLQGGIHLPVRRALPDGSWITTLADPAERARRSVRNSHRKARGSKLPPDTGPLPGITVRAIEFWLTITTGDGGTRTERYLLITTLTDWRAAPAATLAAGYAWRWAIETSYREFKTYLRGPGRVLRGRTPDLARQELWAYLTIHQAIRAVICAAAASARTDPDRISFTATVHAIRRTLPAARTHPAAALADTEAEILAQPVPERGGRVCVRALNETRPAYPPKGATKGPIAQRAAYSLTTRPPHQPPHTRTSQPQHPANQQNQPP